MRLLGRPLFATPGSGDFGEVSETRQRSSCWGLYRADRNMSSDRALGFGLDSFGLDFAPIRPKDARVCVAHGASQGRASQGSCAPSAAHRVPSPPAERRGSWSFAVKFRRHEMQNMKYKKGPHIWRCRKYAHCIKVDPSGGSHGEGSRKKIRCHEERKLATMSRAFLGADNWRAGACKTIKTWFCRFCRAGASVG